MTSTLQSATLANSNLTPDEQKALTRLKTDENTVILPACRQGTGDCCYGQQTYNGKMDALVNDKQTYEVLKATYGLPKLHKPNIPM